MKKSKIKHCLKCKKPESDTIFFAINPRTGKPNGSCEPCLERTRVFQRALQKKRVKEREEAARLAEKPWDHVPWPATLIPYSD